MLVYLKYCVSLFSLLVVLSCGTNTTNKSKGENAAERADTTNVAIVGNPLDQYWKKYTFSVDEVQQYPAEIEQSLVNYLAEFPNYSLEEVDASLKKLVHKTEANPQYFSFVKEKLFLYLYDPNSPMRNDKYFEHVLEAYLLSKSNRDSDKERERLVLELVQKNQEGAVAANFIFKDKGGKQHQMIDYNAPYKLLVFYDPTCTHCNEVIVEMSKSNVLGDAVKSKNLLILAIDPIGNYEEWIKYYSNIPNHWINGIDRAGTLSGTPLYNIQAYPTLYLLDKDNRVILKDTYLSVVENFSFIKIEN